MTPWQDGLIEALSAVGAVAYFVVAYVQWKRPVSRDGMSARNGFVLWWGGLAILGLVGLLSGRLWTIETMAAQRVLLYTFIPLIFVALGGLVHYLLYLYTGKKDLLRFVVVFYALLTVAFVVFVEAQQPFMTPDAETGEMTMEYMAEAPAWAGLLFSLALIFPPFAAAVAYAALFFQAKDRTVRYRIIMVSGGFVLWLGFSLLGSLSSFASGVQEQSFAARVTGQLLGLLSATLVLLAYYPPGPLRRALKLRVLAEAKTDVSGPNDLFDPSRKVRPAVQPITTAPGA